VSGLFSFHGFTPIPQVNAFRGGLGSTNLAATSGMSLQALDALSGGLQSASLSDFQRQSVGLSDVMRGPTYEPTYFADPQRTIADVGYIRNNLNVPGSSVPRSPTALPPQNLQRPIDESAALLAERDVADRRTVDEPGGWNLGWSRPNAATPTTIGGVQVGTVGTRSNDLGGLSPARNALSDEWVSRMANELQRQRLREEVDAAQAESFRGSGPPLTRRRVMDGYTRATVPRAAQVEADTATLLAQPTAPGTETSATAVGADRFRDLFAAVRTAQERGTTGLGIQSPGRVALAEGDVPDAARQPGPGIEAGTRRPRGQRAEPFKEATRSDIGQLATGVRWADELLNEPVKSFAGRYRNQFNGAMLSGEEALRDGDYYSAARRFEMAQTIEPGNPLPFLARGHALVASGDYASGVRSIKAGLERFPQVAAFRLDLPAMVGERDVFDRRRAELETRLSTQEDADLRFLLGYIEFYSNLPDIGLENLKKAAEKAPPDSIIAIFPKLLTGERALPPVAPPKNQSK
jgi:hypothetical protein